MPTVYLSWTNSLNSLIFLKVKGLADAPAENKRPNQNVPHVAAPPPPLKKARAAPQPMPGNQV